jgi:hypothetical protein
VHELVSIVAMNLPEDPIKYIVPGNVKTKLKESHTDTSNGTRHTNVINAGLYQSTRVSSI